MLALSPLSRVDDGLRLRAQALDPDGSLVDDFGISRAGAVTAVRNAPSPAATSALAIARLVCDQAADV